MKKMINLVLVVTMFSTINVFANNFSKTEEDLPKITKAFSAILVEKLNEIVIEKEEKALVIFTINGDNEVTVLDVRTTSKELKRYIKSTLNFNKIENAGLVFGKTYTVNLKFKK